MSESIGAKRSGSRKRVRGAVRRRLSAIWAHVTTTPRIVAAAAAFGSLIIAAVVGPIILTEYQRRIAARDAASAFLDRMVEQIQAVDIAANRYATALDAFGRYSLQLELRRQTLYGEHADKLITGDELAKGEATISEELTRQQAKVDDLKARYEIQIEQFDSWRARAVLEGVRRYPQRNAEMLAAFTRTAAHIERFNQDLANRTLAFAVAGTLRQHEVRNAALSFRAGKITERKFRERLKDAVDVTVAEKKLPRLGLVELRALVSRLQGDSPNAP